MAKKDKEAKKDAKKKGEAEEGAAPGLQSASIAAHPRAKASIRRVRARAGFGVFLLVLVFGHMAGQTWFDATWRGLIAGLVANLIAWRCALFVWRHVLIAELRNAEEVYAERRRAAVEAARAAAPPRDASLARRVTEPIRPVDWREPAIRSLDPVTGVPRVRLLTPAEREEARRQREELRRRKRLGEDAKGRPR